MTLPSTPCPFWYHLSLSRGVCSHYYWIQNFLWAPEVWNRKVSVIVWFNAARWHIQGCHQSVALSFPAGLFTCGRGHWSCMTCRRWFLAMQWWGKSLAQYENLLVSCRNVFLYKWKGLAVFNKYVIHPPLLPKLSPCLLWVTLYTDTKKTALLKPVKVGTFINPHWDPVFTV